MMSKVVYEKGVAPEPQRYQVYVDAGRGERWVAEYSDLHYAQLEVDYRVRGGQCLALVVDLHA